MNDLIRHENHLNTIELFLKNYTSERTREAYMRDLGNFFAYWALKGFRPSHPNELSLGHFVEYRDCLIDKSLSTNTVNRKLSSVKSFMGWLHSEGHIQINPVSSLKLPKIRVNTPTLPFTDEEVLRVLEQPEIKLFYGKVHKLVLLLLFNLGLRRSEAASIKVKDIFEARGHTAIVVTGKGGKTREMPLKESLKNYIQDYIKELGLAPEDYLIQAKKSKRNKKPVSGNTIFRIVSRYAKRAGIDKRVGAHSCRATAISHLLELGESPRNVADFAGHSNISTTVDIYDKKRKGLDDSSAYKVNYGEC